MTDQGRSQISFGKKILFAGVACLMVIGLMELLLRAFGFYDYPRLVVTHVTPEGKKIYRINESIGKRYFRDHIGEKTIQMPKIYPDTLEYEKPANEYRIFVLGGSSVQGYPYAYNIAFPAQLEILLSKRFPEKSFVVVNCGVTALNSFALVDFTAELMDYSPDLIIVYSGHNEFYGAYGSGSSIFISRNRLFTRGLMFLQRSAVYREIQSISSKFTETVKTPNAPVGLIEIMAKEKSIPLSSPVVTDTLNNYAGNLRAICKNAQQHDVPVLFCTLVFNVEGLSPMGADLEDSKEFQALKYGGLKSLNERDPTGANVAAAKLKELFPENAWGYYIVGKSANGINPGSGCSELKMARDLDGLRFRAPSGLNKIVLETAEHIGGTVFSLDLEPVFDIAARIGCPGYDLFVDHVHPVAFGHYLIARSIAERLESIGLTPAPAGDSVWIDWETCREEAGFTDIENMITLMQVIMLYRSYPLQTLPEASPRIQETTRYISSIYDRLPETMKKVYERWVQEGGKFDIHFEAGKSYIESGDYQSAVREFTLALKAHPENQSIKEHLDKAKQNTFPSNPGETR